MVGKLTTVLIKKEADAYRAQGLHNEALNLYDQLLCSSPNIDPCLKDAIKSQIKGISADLETFVSTRDKPLSVAEIVRIKEGWGDNASEADIMVCAQAFCQIGAYGDALEEFKKLLKTGCMPTKLVGSVAICLAELHDPESMPDAVGLLLADVFPSHDQSLAFQLLLAKSLAGRSDKSHALHYYRHLAAKSDLPPDIAGRIQAVIAKYEKNHGLTPPLPDSIPAQNAQPELKKGLFRRLFKS